MSYSNYYYNDTSGPQDHNAQFNYGQSDEDQTTGYPSYHDAQQGPVEYVNGDDQSL
ncbi:hypothetical protein MCOR25_007390 [Pyricularia grisea]|nr:hypothetical protein MCOR25_007390 [Pyricularia grisea]